MASPRRDGKNFDADDFQRALDESGPESSGPPVEAAAPLKIHLPGDMPRSEGGGGDSRWRMAMAWAGATEDRASATSSAALPAAPAPAALPPTTLADPGDAEAVRRELGLDRPLSVAELSARWRAFLWRNHPDRLPPEARAGANARVAIANALRDQARR